MALAIATAAFAGPAADAASSARGSHGDGGGLDCAGALALGGQREQFLQELLHEADRLDDVDVRAELAFMAQPSSVPALARKWWRLQTPSLHQTLHETDHSAVIPGDLTWRARTAPGERLRLCRHEEPGSQWDSLAAPIANEFRECHQVPWGHEVCPPSSVVNARH